MIKMFSRGCISNLTAESDEALVGKMLFSIKTALGQSYSLGRRKERERKHPFERTTSDASFPADPHGSI